MTALDSRGQAPLQRRLPVPSVGDVALAVALCALEVATFAGLPRLPFGLGVAYAVAGYAALAWRRFAPRSVFAVMAIHVVVAGIWLLPYAPLLGVLTALYTVARKTRRRDSVIALGVGYLSLVGVSLPVEIDQGAGLRPDAGRTAAVLANLSAYAIVTGLAWGIGRWIRRSQETISDLEVQRERAAEEAVRAERQRVARELHDIVSHSVSVIVLQAAGARRVLSREPQRAEEALSHIEGVAKETMIELRRLLGVLHDGALSSATDSVAQRGLDDLPELVRGMRASGLEIRLEESGDRMRLELSVDLSAYRIVQESLTNTLKHAGTRASVLVRLRWTRQQLHIEVVDDGGASADPALSTGHGLPGLRERARAVGGSLQVGPVAGGGFRVAAELPVAEGQFPRPASMSD